MAATTVESFLNLPNPLTKRDRRRSSVSSASFSVQFEPVLIPITPDHITTRRKSWTNISSTIARNTIINVSPKLGSRRLGTCFLSLDPPIHCTWFNSRLVVAVPAAFASSSAGKQDNDSDEHSEIDDVENDDQKKKKSTTEIAAADDDVENEKKMISSSSDDQNIEVLLNAAAEEEEEEEESQEEEEAAAAAAANWNWRQIVVIISRKLVNWRQIVVIISRKLVDSVKEYLISADNKSPEEVIKDIIVEIFAYSSSSSSTPDHLIKDGSKLEDFYLGIPYGALLSLGGFLSFMITGSISGIRFGVILGGALLALSISSLRYSYVTKKSRRRRDQSSAPLQQQQQAIMKLGQAAIAGIIFLRHLGLLFQRPSFPNSFTALISGGMLVFYLYTIMLDGGGLIVRKKNNRSES